MIPLYKPYDYNFGGLLSNLKIHRGLKYIILNTLGIDPAPPSPNSHKNKVFCYVDKKCKISAHFYHPRDSSIYVTGPIK
jgi:hypothetical protein